MERTERKDKLVVLTEQLIEKLWNEIKFDGMAATSGSAEWGFICMRNWMNDGLMIWNQLDVYNELANDLLDF